MMKCCKLPTTFIIKVLLFRHWI